MTPEQCLDWMAGALNMTSESGRDFLRTEIRRYTTTPSHQMSYMIGKREIHKLLEAARERDGDAFSLKKFHDALLAEGSVPPALMWDVLGLRKN